MFLSFNTANNPAASLPGHHTHLQQLTYIRVLILFGLCAAMLFAIYVLHAEIDSFLAMATLSMMAVINLVTYARLHSAWPVTETELFCQLTADAVFYASLLYQTGGATNPFIFLLLIPLIVCASTISWRYTWMMAGLVVALYSSLLHYFIPILHPDTTHHHSLLSLFELHIQGMWFNFMLTIFLVTWFVVRMQQTLRSQEQRLQSEREQRIQDQQLISLATMAAGTAHELGTPLATMSVLLKDMSLDHPDDEVLQEDIAILQQQVALCSTKLKEMAKSVRDDEEHQLPITELLEHVIEQWQVVRPEVTFNTTIQPVTAHTPLPAVSGSNALRQALLNLLNNAADASPDDIEITLTWDETYIWLKIHDQGPGLPIQNAANLGKPFMTTKGKGLGIGLFLTATTLAQRDGEVRLYNHPQGGTLTEVRLPLHPATLV